MPFFNAIPSFLKSPLTPEQTPPMKSSPLVVEPTLTADDDKSTGVSSAHSSKCVFLSFFFFLMTSFFFFFFFLQAGQCIVLNSRVSEWAWRRYYWASAHGKSA